MNIDNQADITKKTLYSKASLSNLRFEPKVIALLSDWVKDPKNILILTGNYGVGKTYFCAALTNYFREERKRTYYLNVKGFFAILKEEMNRPGGSVEYRISTMASYDLIFMLDEFGNSQMTEWQIESLAQFIDDRISNNLPLIICSNTWMKDMASKFNEAISSRLNRSVNTIIELKGQDLRLQGL